MVDNSLISIIIPVYNAENYLEQCILSAMNQTWPNKEIIVVVDGAIDGSLSVAQKLEGNLVKVISQPNKGASAARNKGLQEAKGRYIQFLDADDLLSSDKIAEQVMLLEQHPDKIAVCSTIHFNDGGRFHDTSPLAYEESFLIDADPVHFLINLWGGYGENGSMVQPNAWLTPRHLIDQAGPWNETLSLDDDGEFFCRVLLQSKGVLRSAGKNFYRKFPGITKNLSASKDEESLLSQYRSLQLKYQHISKFNSSAHLKKAYLRSLYHMQFNAYPNNLRIIKLIEQEIKEVRSPLKFKPPFATRTGRILSVLFGWKAAKQMQFAKHFFSK